MIILKTKYFLLLLLIFFSINTRAGSILISKNGSEFSDAAAATPVGGNTGTTIGQQRTMVVDYAASLWTSILSPNANLTISISFVSLSCNASTALFASSTVSNPTRNFVGAINSTTWYPTALKNHLTSTNGLVGSTQINKNIGAVGCLPAYPWYYGLDHAADNSTDLLNIVMHEIAHHLGFGTYVNLINGAKFTDGSACSSGCDDIFMKFLQDDSSGKSWPTMSNAERVASAINTGKLVWSGSQAQHMKETLLSGSLQNGYPEIYAPNPVVPGSSVAHWNTTVKYSQLINGKIPREMMQYTPDNGGAHEMALTVAVMRDMGWSGASYDYDKDGAPDETDAFPHKIAADADADGDGMVDDWTAASSCSGSICDGFILDGDDDGDGVQDVVDADSLDANNVNEINLPFNKNYKGLEYRNSINK